MKTNINNLKTTPKNFPFAFCVYGEPNEHILQWMKDWKITSIQSGEYKNLVLPDGISLQDIFIDSKGYKYVDAFSPNLNKKLHFGHLTNLIIAKFIQKIGIGEKFIAVLGDTLTGKINKEEALKDFYYYCNLFDYKVDKILYASEQKIKDESILSDGEDDYEGTKIFELNNQKIVGIKNSGQTSYFYQDVAVAQLLNSPTLYVTGFEQNEHFSSLKILFPDIDHIGMGLVTLDGKKMSSSEGNVIMVEDYLSKLKNIFNDDKLIYNVIAGSILSSGINSVKQINTSDILNVKKSAGLYISYTQAKMWSAGLPYEEIDKFSNIELEYKYLKAKYNIQPNILLQGAVQTCEKINQLYEKHYIKDNEENKKMFQVLLNDLMLACKYLGLFKIEKV
jgi:hypothetical protein